MSSVGLVGLGRMGSRMSKRLLESGYDVVGYDIRDEAVEELERAGGLGADSAATVAEDTGIVVTSLPTPEIVEQVFCDDNGLLSADANDVTVLETSTSTPETTRTLAEVAEAERIHVVDAPVSGGTEGAQSGALTFMVGASKADLDSSAVDVLEALGRNVYFLDRVGAGHATKLVNNVLSAGNRALAMEAMALGTAQGVEPEALFEVISNASGSSNQFEKRIPRVLNRNFEPGFTVDLSRKDVKLALEAGNSIDYPMMLTSLVHEYYKETCAAGYGKEDASALVKVFEENAKVRIEARSEVDETFEGY